MPTRNSFTLTSWSLHCRRSLALSASSLPWLQSSNKSHLCLNFFARWSKRSSLCKIQLQWLLLIITCDAKCSGIGRVFSFNNRLNNPWLHQGPTRTRFDNFIPLARYVRSNNERYMDTDLITFIFRTATRRWCKTSALGEYTDRLKVVRGETSQWFQVLQQINTPTTSRSLMRSKHSILVNVTSKQSIDKVCWSKNLRRNYISVRQEAVWWYERQINYIRLSWFAVSLASGSEGKQIFARYFSIFIDHFQFATQVKREFNAPIVW